MITEVKRLPGLPVLLRAVGPDYRSTDQTHILFYEEDAASLDAESAPIYYILDIQQMTMGINDVLQSAQNTPAQLRLLKHPKIIETLVITKSRLIELAARGMNSPLFGSVTMKTFSNPEAALDYVRQQTTNK
jgi:hypothetical protein